MRIGIDSMMVAIQTMSEAADSTERNSVPVSTLSMSTSHSGPALKQLTFNLKAQDKYNKLLNFEIKLKSIFHIQMKRYYIYDSERVPKIYIRYDVKDSFLCKQ